MECVQKPSDLIDFLGKAESTKRLHAGQTDGKTVERSRASGSQRDEPPMQIRMKMTMTL